MANQPGGEGNVLSLDENNNPEDLAGRYLIFETPDGKINSGKFSENHLKKMFADADLNLQDYTFAAPAPPEYARLPIDPNSEGVALGGPENPSDGNTRAVKNSSQRENKPRSPHAQNDGDSTETTSWDIWIGIASIGVLALACVLRRFFLSRSLRKT